ncbi:calpain-B-like [Malaya genurostris]|uniref:calpain-B-like n=1 Tax=Malaya genurostris TaxID=325434 RepID=UPI0026F3EDCB|nr:calpain-B-like [Malaya genurostris]XP_058461586.1 calpain-B-like [Malaya genurostris]XP_058461587.1 calpain-B-like [Malaya genurostris]
MAARVIRGSVGSDGGSSTSSLRSSRFIVVDFTNDNDEIAHKCFNNRQNPPAQDFYQLKQRCLSEGILFEDPDFPPDHSSLTKCQTSPNPTIEWLRPRQICRKAKFFVDGASRFDVRQGSLNDCWLLTAVANLTANQRLFRKTVPLDNTFADEDYAGIFHFRFWQFGQWVDVVIDDRLPTRDGELIYMRSSHKNEFWSALLEKAYAKLYGSYETLNSGTAREAMQDFTGGITESYRLKGKEPPPENLFDIIQSGFERGSTFACNILPDPNVPEAHTPQGLLKGHSYSITKTHVFDPTKHQLIRLRNPWGDGMEWNGAWSDRSKEWDAIPKAQRKAIGLTIDNDGEFWMNFQDFVRYFDRVEICNLSPDPFDDPEASLRGWQVSTVNGEWIKGSTAGGCIDYLDSFWVNPQYVIRLDQPDRDDKYGMCTVVIALMQKFRRAEYLPSLTIGFVVYRISEKDLQYKPVPKKFFKANDHRIVARSIYINSREVSSRLKLSPGIYLIVPTTFQPDEEGDFMVRIFSELRNCLEENDCIVCFGTLDDRISGPLLENGDWEQMVRSFYDMANRKGKIDYLALGAILDKFFFSPQVKPKKRMNFWKAMSLRLQHVLFCWWISAARPKHPTTQTKTFNHVVVQQISKLLISRVNLNNSTLLNYDQFRTIVRDVQQWQAVFNLYDLDHSGHLDRKELKRALNSSGFNVNNRVLHELMKHSRERGQETMELVDFVLCAVEGRNAIEKLLQNPTDKPT